MYPANALSRCKLSLKTTFAKAKAQFNLINTITVCTSALLLVMAGLLVFPTTPGPITGLPNVHATPDPLVPASTPSLTANTGLTDTDSNTIPNLDLSTATPTATGSVVSGSMALGVTTNNPTGYNLKLRTSSTNGNMVNTANSAYTVAPIATGTITTPVALTSNTWGFAIPKTQTNSTGLVSSGFDNTYTAETNNQSSTSKWAAVPTADTTIKTTTAANATNDNTTVFYGAKATTSLVSGAYKGNIVYTTTANDVPAPTITNVDPDTGTTAGGTSITITGNNFYNQASTVKVTVGGTDCTSYTVNSNNQITCVTPAHAAGTVDVKVTTVSGGTVTKASGFTVSV